MDSNLRSFLREIMDMQLGLPGMGSVSSGITGTTGTQGAVAERLKTSAALFARAYENSEHDPIGFIKHAKELEGNLFAARSVNGISEEKFIKLIDMLHETVSDKTNDQVE